MQKIINVAILVYNGVYLLDFTGPLEVFYDSCSENNEHLFNVYTVAPESNIKAHCGLKINPDFELSSCPVPDILVVPGGNSALLKDHPALKDWLITVADKAKTVMSVCTGAFILADAGLLNGLNITTWHGALNELQEKTTGAMISTNVRYTDNGKIITTAGISAGIDGALHVVAAYFGKDAADATARYMDYEYWNN